MVYRASDGDRSALGVAFSPDGITWRKSSHPIVTNSSSPNWNKIYFNAVLSIQQRWFVYFEAGVDGGGTAVHVILHETKTP